MGEISQKAPETREGRMAVLKKLPNGEKKRFMPGPGSKLQVGPFVYLVTAVNAKQFKFIASLHDVIIEGVNDGTSPIIDPHTGENVVTNNGR